MRACVDHPVVSLVQGRDVDVGDFSRRYGTFDTLMMILRHR